MSDATNGHGHSNGNGTTHDFKPRPLSHMQWSLLRILTNQARNGREYLTAEEVASYKQTTMGSFARGSRGYVKKVGENRFRITSEALRARSEFEAADVMRQAESMEISIWFRGGPRSQK
jgi:hypothetical protein